MSERLKSLERELNCTLFLRRKGSRDLVLTVDGETFCDPALQYRNMVRKNVAEPPVFLCTADSSYPSTVDTSMLSIKNQIYAPWSSDLERWQQTDYYFRGDFVYAGMLVNEKRFPKA